MVASIERQCESIRESIDHATVNGKIARPLLEILITWQDECGNGGAMAGGSACYEPSEIFRSVVLIS